jgi:hypothetical protein
LDTQPFLKNRYVSSLSLRSPSCDKWRIHMTATYFFGN